MSREAASPLASRPAPARPGAVQLAAAQHAWAKLDRRTLRALRPCRTRAALGVLGRARLDARAPAPLQRPDNETAGNSVGVRVPITGGAAPPRIQLDPGGRQPPPSAPPPVAGFVAICAPLAGTTRGKLAPWKDLRGITPDGPFIRDLIATRHKLDAWGRPILTIGAARDAFLSPADSAFLPGHPTLRLEHSGHVASLFDVRTHAAVADFVRAVARGRQG